MAAQADASVAIATVADRRFLPAASCQLVSVARHLDPGRDVQLFLVLCDVSDGDIADAARFFHSHGMSVEIVVPDFVDRMAPPLATRWPRAAYLRLYFDWIFDERWKRIVYFDADTRVRAPLLPLLTADLRGQPIGAVHDFIYYTTGNIHRRRRDLFLAPDAPYFQSGVMVFDWPATLGMGGLDAARTFLSEHPESCYEAPDQDALNATFENHWTPLDPRWNLHEHYLMFGRRLQPWVTHFTGVKPWSRKRPRAWRSAAEWYRRELVDSPWTSFVEPQSASQAFRADLKFAIRRLLPYGWEFMEHMPFVLRRLPGERYRRYKRGHLPWMPRRSSDVEAMAMALVAEADGRSAPLRPPEAALPGRHR